ncbi:MAG: MFS transporter [Cyanobacteria bacterium PR.3.49]|nr:MFS transporter [Cyanobacteria bacterium PR.3.49]
MIRAKLLTYLCYGAMMSLAIGINLLPIFLVSIQHSFPGASGTGLTQEELGRIGSVAFVGLVFAILATGPLADRMGAKAFALAGNILLAIGLAITSWSPNYAVLLVANFILGFGAGVLDMVLSPVVSAINPENRSSSMNWLHSFYCVGATITVLAGTAALQCGISWRAACLILIPLPIALIFALGAQKFPALTEEGEERTPFQKLITDPWFFGALVAIFLGGATELGMAQWLPAYAELGLKYPQWVGGTALFLFSICMAIGRMGIGALSEKINPVTIMAWGCGLSVVLFLLGSFFPIKLVALGACVLAGLTGSCLWPTMLAITADKYPNGGATMFGALAAFGNAGGIFMPWAVGVIADHSSLAYGLAVSALAPFFMLPIVLILGRKTACAK